MAIPPLERHCLYRVAFRSSKPDDDEVALCVRIYGIENLSGYWERDIHSSGMLPLHFIYAGARAILTRPSGLRRLPP